MAELIAADGGPARHKDATSDQRQARMTPTELPCPLLAQGTSAAAQAWPPSTIALRRIEERAPVDCLP